MTAGRPGTAARRSSGAPPRGAGGPAGEALWPPPYRILYYLPRLPLQVNRVILTSQDFGPSPFSAAPSQASAAPEARADARLRLISRDEPPLPGAPNLQNGPP
jgi:hypothetical protein